MPGSLFGDSNGPDPQSFECTDATISTESGEQRIYLNFWAANYVYGYIDFEKILRDPAFPSRLLPRFDSGETGLGSPDGAQWLMNQGRAVYSQ